MYFCSPTEFHIALQWFIKYYPQYANLEIYLTGESYAGKYIPSISYKILQTNKHPEILPVNFRGLAIGNGWVHPIDQNQAYVDYPYALGLIDTEDKRKAQLIMDQFVDAILSEEWDDANDLSNDLENLVVTASSVDVDNVLFASDPTNQYITDMTGYLNSPATRAALNVENHTWTFCATGPYNALNSDEQKSVLHLIPHLIKNYKVMIYTGNMDMNCNVLGVEKYLSHMQWPDYSKFLKAPRNNWRSKDGDLAGYGKQYGNLTTVVVRNAGHEVPFYQPANAQDMIYRFIENKPWN